MPAGDLPEGPGGLPEAAGGYAQALPRSNDRPLLAQDPRTPRGGHDKARAGARPRWRRGPPLQPASQGELQWGYLGARQAIRGAHRAGGAGDNAGTLRLRLAPRRSTRPARLPTYPRLRSPGGG